VAASYVLCTAMDEAINRTAWAGGKDGQPGAWATQQLAQTFHNDSLGGEKVFLLIGRLAANSHEHIDLIDLLFFVLSVGFEGRYRAAPNGRRELDAIRHRLFDIVAAAHGKVPRELSPNWKGEAPGTFRTLTDLPVWVTVCVLSLVLLVMFSWYKYQLSQQTAEVVAGIRAIGAMRPVPPPERNPLRLKELLAPEIAAGTVSVQEDDKESVVSFKGDGMFVAGQARLDAKVLPAIAKVAHEINEVAGTVRITGHSDNRPIKTRAFLNNQALSEARARAVADVLKGGGVAAERLSVEGKGDTQPLADNATAAGRSLNRRVDIIVMQGELPASAISPGSILAD
jgi:type VI secretion system protein ImpK